MKGSPKVTIIGHSRGGLVAKIALLQLKDAGALDRVERVVGCGVPHHGSHWTIGLLAGFHPAAKTVIDMVESGFPPIISPVKIVDPKFKGEIVRIFCTFPSIYQLLPNPNAPGLVPADARGIYDAANWIDSEVPIVRGWLDYAKKHWMDHDIDPVGPRWKTLVGTGHATPNKIRDGYFNVLDKARCLSFGGDGDGIVTKEWQRAGNMDIREIESTHEEYFTTVRGREELHRALTE